MLDDVPVESVGAQAVRPVVELQVLVRDERQQVTLATAVGAVALHHLIDAGLELERDIAAMAAAPVFHDDSFIAQDREC
jgi:hypothetical protein